MSKQRRAAVVALACLSTACENLPFHAVSIRPTYGWVDGCTEVRISGHGFEDKVSASIDGKLVTEITLPDKPLDKGYTFTGLTPAGSPGEATVKVTSGDESEMIEQGFYYIACPASPHVDAASATEAAVGDTIVLSGCNLEASATRVELRAEDGSPTGNLATLSGVCTTAQASFTVPSVAAGTYHLYLVDEAGNDLWPLSSCDYFVPDTSDTAAGCDAPPTLVVGGGR